MIWWICKNAMECDYDSCSHGIPHHNMGEPCGKDGFCVYNGIHMFCYIIKTQSELISISESIKLKKVLDTHLKKNSKEVVR
jgi:hypothetical protein